MGNTCGSGVRLSVAAADSRLTGDAGVRSDAGVTATAEGGAVIALVFREFESLRRPLPESPAGGLWFVVDGTCFPGENWSDFPLSVLSSAFVAYRELSRGADMAISHLFDGPFDLYYRRSGPGPDALVRIEAYREGSYETGRILRAETEVTLPALRQALRDSAAEMADYLSRSEGAGGVNSSIVARMLEQLDHG